MLTASSLDAAEACLGSVVYSPIDEPGPYAAGGSAAHRFLETARADRDRALREAPEDDRDFFASIDLAAIPAGLDSEVAVAYHPERDEGRILTGVRAREYPDLGEGWIYGTADLLGQADGGVVHVPDLKRYRAPRAAAESLQLSLYALAACRSIESDAAVVSFLVPRADGRWYTDRAELDALDLDAIRLRLLRLQRQESAARAGGPVQLRVGDHCTYCRSRRLCPAQATPVALVAAANLEALAAESLPEPAAVKARIEALTPEARGRLYQRVKIAEKFLETVVDALRDDARQVPIPIGRDQELREVPWSTWASTETAKAEIAELKEDLERRGEIRKVSTTQVRVVKARGRAA